ncbi:methyltransferase domain-containing protein [Flavobacterium aurantiibacter]|uniref:Methyltransferase type 11 n=1 Tax=Flavobacterium aurantiibacter TaxID=2023067 RepID=A0A255ZAN9_9FLAO|nr:methyltransferase domain-containing protein [Flavobacterium aurantiibacter]OYQ38526.1 hypothetical protein CHX27_14760 [Flavobacterium aurantiibacter]
MEIIDFADNVYLKDGIWFSKNNRDISYPKEGNMNCYEIEKDSFWFQHRNNCILETVRFYSEHETFFDIGGGNGYVAKGLEDNNIKTVLVEPGLEGALNAKKRGLSNIICSTFEDAGIKVNSCKSIGLFDVVEHIADDQQFLMSVYSNLAVNGFVYITVPAYNFLWSKEDADAGHYRRYTKRQICRVLEDSGFKIQYATYIFSILPLPVFFFRTIPSFFWLKRNSSDLSKHKQEHSQRKGLIALILNFIWNKEISYIKQKKKIPFGGSCLVVAKKTS